MSNRSSAIMLIAAVVGCMLLAMCGVVLVGGYFLLLNGNPLASVGAPAVVNRIVFVGNDANIYVADPTTQTTTAITKDGGDNQVYNYPTWAPDSHRLAFVGYTLKDGSPTEGTLYTVSPTGEQLTPVYKTPQNFPFYLYWSPDSQLVGFLANKDAQHIALRVAHTDQADSMQELDSGAPLYWAWSPDSSQLFAHVGGTRADNEDARLALVPFNNGNSQHPLEALPGAFQAPQWSRDGRLLFSTQADSEQEVAIANAQGSDIKKLFSYKGRASFALSPDGTQVAYMVTDSEVQLPHFSIVRVIDATGGNARAISQDPALAFLWSPDSKKVAYLTVSVGENQNFNPRAPLPLLATTHPERFITAPPTYQGGQNRIQLHWNVWDSTTGQSKRIATLLPTTSFLSVIPYFDQYANSSTFWSPDSLSFVYTTRELQDTGSVWIADVSNKNAPRKIGDGVIAFWSWR
ncbi:MAG TPA: hypothetical protein VFD70_04210 [Anaerolineae bacterium]|nr:hypothetical protein [Anaerolineae bacterium]